MYKIDQIKENEQNPRWISESDLERLAQSISEFKKMMELRPIIVDEDNVILAGNMRFQACKKLGMEELPKKWVTKITGLSQDQKNQLVVKDNVNYGDWDFDILSEQYQDQKEMLENLGIDYWQAGDIQFDYGILDDNPEIQTRAIELTKNVKRAIQIPFNKDQDQEECMEVFRMLRKLGHKISDEVYDFFQTEAAKLNLEE